MSPTTTPVREYHNGLAQHLLDLIRKSTSALASASASASPDTTPRTRKTQVVTPPLPANPRQHSDSSLDSNSKISSGETTQSRKSSVERTEQSTVDEREEEERRGSDVDATSERNDMTARPDVHPPRFPSIPQLNVEDTPQDAEVAESSLAAAQRHAAAARPSPSSTSPTNDSGKIPRSRISTYPTTYAEHLTREAEHRKAWETTGRKVWRNMPVNFELKLAPIDLKQKKKARSGSNESNSHSHSQSASEISGAGPGTAIRPDDVFVPELEGDGEQEQERMSSSNPTNIETVSEVSRNEGGEGESGGGGPMPSESSISMSIAKPTIKRRSTLQRRQARVEAEATADAKAKAAAEHPEQSHDPEPEVETEPDTQLGSEDEQAEYARKREMRLRKKEQALKKRIGTWWAGVSEHSTPASSAAVTPPEIEPHIPSPKLEYAGYGDHKSMLRFPPLPTSMPDFIGGDSPMLKLPSLQLIEDGRRSRPGFELEPLNVDMGRGGKTTDIDLLIRLTEMSRVSSPSAAAGGGGAGRARFPSAPPAHSSGGLISGDRIETHSFNVRGSTTTPKPGPAMRSVFSGFGSQI